MWKNVNASSSVSRFASFSWQTYIHVYTQMMHHFTRHISGYRLEHLSLRCVEYLITVACGMIDTFNLFVCLVSLQVSSASFFSVQILCYKVDITRAV